MLAAARHELCFATGTLLAAAVSHITLLPALCRAALHSYNHGGLQLGLVDLSPDFVGCTYERLVGAILAADGSICLGLFRPVGTKDNLMPYFSTNPRRREVVRPGDRALLLKSSEQPRARRNSATKPTCSLRRWSRKDPRIKQSSAMTLPFLSLSPERTLW